MKKLLQSITLLLFTISFGQNILEINKNLKISASITHKKEIRIYKKIEITNYSELIRLFL